MKEILYPEKGELQFSLRKAIWLYLMIIPCFFIDFSLLTLEIMLVGAGLTFFTICLGHSIGLHRGIIHKSYETTDWFQNILVYLFVLTGLGGPISWMKLHYYRDY